MRSKRNSKKNSESDPQLNSMEHYHFEDEHDAIQHFFSWFTVEETHDLLTELFNHWVAFQDQARLDSTQKDRRTFFYEQLKIVVAAIFMAEEKWIADGNKLHYIITRKA